MIGPIGFAAPWLLVALAALPVLWIILRAVPPAPIRRRFPGVALLLGLNDDDTVTDRTPWWLLLLRMLAVAALIIGLAGPVLNPQADPSDRRTGPLLIVMDATWASARDWPSQTALIDTILAEAGREARPAAILRLSDPEAPVFQSAEAWRTRLTGLSPEPWAPTATDLAAIPDLLGDEDFETRWFSAGLARPGRTHPQMLACKKARGTCRLDGSFSDDTAALGVSCIGCLGHNSPDVLLHCMVSGRRLVAEQDGRCLARQRRQFRACVGPDRCRSCADDLDHCRDR